jgi:hypothetical protein
MCVLFIPVPFIAASLIIISLGPMLIGAGATCYNTYIPLSSHSLCQFRRHAQHDTVWGLLFLVQPACSLLIRRRSCLYR